MERDKVASNNDLLLDFLTDFNNLLFFYGRLGKRARDEIIARVKNNNNNKRGGCSSSDSTSDGTATTTTKLTATTVKEIEFCLKNL